MPRTFALLHITSKVDFSNRSDSAPRVTNTGQLIAFQNGNKSTSVSGPTRNASPMPGS